MSVALELGMHVIVSMNVYQILVVDDFAPWRDRVRSLLKVRPEWKIIGEASDGPEAIEKATATRPDIVLLDIGMPLLNGIETAKILRQKCPKSKVLFVTQESDSDIRNAAVRVGAVGYVLKANAGTELLDAITDALNCYPAALSTKSR